MERQLAPILPSGQRQQVLTRVVSIVQSEQFSGPIAHPKHLKEYEQTVPGAGDRIIRMAESQLEHAQACQKRALEADIADMRSGRLYGLIALLVLIISSAVSGYFGMERIALAMLGVGAIGAVTALIKGRGGHAKNG